MIDSICLDRDGEGMRSASSEAVLRDALTTGRGHRDFLETGREDLRGADKRLRSALHLRVCDVFVTLSATADATARAYAHRAGGLRPYRCYNLAIESAMISADLTAYLDEKRVLG